MYLESIHYQNLQEHFIPKQEIYFIQHQKVKNQIIYFIYHYKILTIFIYILGKINKSIDKIKEIEEINEDDDLEEGIKECDMTTNPTLKLKKGTQVSIFKHSSSSSSISKTKKKQYHKYNESFKL